MIAGTQWLARRIAMPPFTRLVLPLAAGLFPPRPAGRGIQRRLFVNGVSKDRTIMTPLYCPAIGHKPYALLFRDTSEGLTFPTSHS